MYTFTNAPIHTRVKIYSFHDKYRKINSKKDIYFYLHFSAKQTKFKPNNLGFNGLLKPIIKASLAPVSSGFTIVVLQVLTDVLSEVDQVNKVDVRTEEPEQTTIRLLTMLRVLKYKPTNDINV